MFGLPMLKPRRRPIGGLAEDGVMFKLPVDSDEIKLALSLKGSHLFAPSIWQYNNDEAMGDCAV